MVLCGSVSVVQDFEANKVVVTSLLDLTWLELLAYRHTLKNRVELWKCWWIITMEEYLDTRRQLQI